MKKTRIKNLSVRQSVRINKLSQIAQPVDGLCERCQKVGDFRGLVKHHLKLRSDGGEDKRSNLMWVCGPCHDRFHGIVRKPSKPVDREPFLAGYGHGFPISKEQQVGKKA